MSDDAIAILIMLFWALAAYAVYLRLFVVRRLRKRLDKVADAVIATQPVAAKQALAAVQPEVEDLRRIQQRLQVLERIAVEKENTLSREIEDLRAAG
jgi:hypothetical protein